MAGADYAHCERCLAKAVYDAEIDYSTPTLGALVVLCASCYADGYRLAVVRA